MYLCSGHFSGPLAVGEDVKHWECRKSIKDVALRPCRRCCAPESGCLSINSIMF